jgi:hypothetical protein
MPAKKPAAPHTLAYLGEIGRAVYSVCEHCGHFAPVSCYKLATRFGWATPQASVASHLKCRQCGKKRAKLTVDRPERRVCPHCRRPLP